MSGERRPAPEASRATYGITGPAVAEAEAGASGQQGAGGRRAGRAADSGKAGCRALRAEPEQTAHYHEMEARLAEFAARQRRGVDLFFMDEVHATHVPFRTTASTNSLAFRRARHGSDNAP